jgi:hypothetical protein
MNKDDYVKLMQKYIEATKSVVQLAIGSLILPIFFIRKILGKPEGQSVSQYIDWIIITSWVCLGISVGAGAVYHWLAVSRIEKKFEDSIEPSNAPRIWFAITYAAFFVGIVFFIVWAGIALS